MILFVSQFFVDRIEQLVQLKHMHMLRWARFCEHTRAIENLYPAYQSRLRYTTVCSDNRHSTSPVNQDIASTVSWHLIAYSILLLVIRLK